LIRKASQCTLDPLTVCALQDKKRGTSIVPFVAGTKTKTFPG
jgi:hypothetical protein